MTVTYLVEGYAPDYTGHESWPVQVYTDKEAADRHCAAAQAWTDKVENTFQSQGDPFFTALRILGLKNPYDPNYSPGEDGVMYRVVEIPEPTQPLDFSLAETWSLAAPGEQDIQRCIDDISEAMPEDLTEAIRFILLSQGIHPEYEYQGLPAIDFVKSKLPQVSKSDA